MLPNGLEMGRPASLFRLALAYLDAGRAESGPASGKALRRGEAAQSVDRCVTAPGKAVGGNPVADLRIGRFTQEQDEKQKGEEGQKAKDDQGVAGAWVSGRTHRPPSRSRARFELSCVSAF